LKIIPVNDAGEIILEEYEKLLSDRTKLVSIAHIANSTGVVHPIAHMIQLAHAKGAKFLVDAAQSAAHYPLDVKNWDADFLVFSAHKALGPTGVGILYGKKELLEKMPPYQGGGDMIEQVSFESTTFQPPPLKFEAGTPSIVEVIGLGAAIQYIEKIGRENIYRWEKKLTDYALNKLRLIPEVCIVADAKEKSSIISFVCKGIHSLDIGTMLDLRGIAVRTGHHCAQPAMKRFGVSSTVRLSFAMYNTFEEIDLFVEALKEVILMLRPSLSY
jgi:cysteine desulfurase / selenocysteine lyase